MIIDRTVPEEIWRGTGVSLYDTYLPDPRYPDQPKADLDLRDLIASLSDGGWSRKQIAVWLRNDHNL